MEDDVEEVKEDEKITLFSVGNQVFVWSAEDVLKLRSKHRIIGSLVGSLPRKPKQNVCLSLPLLLSEDETTLLLQKNLASLVDSQTSLSVPSEEEVKIFNELREQSIKEQIELFNEQNIEKEKEMRDYVEDARKKKKRKGRKRRMADNEDIQKPEKLLKTEDSEKLFQNNRRIQEDHNLEKTISIQNVDISNADTSQYQDCEKDESTIRDFKQKESHFLTADPQCTEDISNSVDSKMTTSADIRHNTSNTPEVQDLAQREKNCVIHIPTKMPACKIKNFPTQQWHYPRTEQEQIKFKIFNDLWEKGYYLTSGSKFGGDFLAYPGDPFKFHSFFVVMVMPQSKKIRMLDLIAIGRLAATVKKTAVLGTVDSNGDVVYSSIKWSGIS